MIVRLGLIPSLRQRIAAEDVLDQQKVYHMHGLPVMVSFAENACSPLGGV